MKKNVVKFPRILVLGVGSAFSGDDAFGPAVVKMLAKRALPEFVSLKNGSGSTIGRSLVWIMEDYDIVLVADIVTGIGEPGATERIEWKEFKSDTETAFSVHELGLAEAIEFAKFAEWKIPKIIVFGVEPKTTEFGTTELSEEVARAVPTVAKMISEELEKFV
jgi:hydrogenase maturation protease